jgi:hypothetical protein
MTTSLKAPPQLSLETRTAILRWHMAGIPRKEICQHFGIDRETLRWIIRHPPVLRLQPPHE